MRFSCDRPRTERPARLGARLLRCAGLALLACAVLGNGEPQGKNADPGKAPGEPAQGPAPAPSEQGSPVPGETAPPAKPAGADKKPASKPGKPARGGGAKADPAPAPGASSPDGLLQSIQRHYEHVHDLRASFVQESNVASLGRKDTSSGSVAVKRPGRMRWEYKTPEVRVLLIDGSTVKMYTPSEKQLQVAPLDAKAFSPTALTFLLGDGQLRDTFAAEPISEPGRAEVGVRLRPRNDASFEYLELWLAPGVLTLRESVVVDLFGNRTSVRFSDVVENAEVPEKTFALDVPKDTEVIDLR